MKVQNWVLTALAFIMVFTVSANTKPKMNVIPIDSHKAMITFVCPIPFPLEVSITNETGELLYYNKIVARQKEYKNIFSFEEFGTGTYNVSMNYGTQSINRNLNVSKRKIEVGPAENLFEPHFCLKNDKLHVSFLNITNKPVYLSFIKDGEQIAKKKLGKEMTLQKCVNLSKLEKGKYEIVLCEWFGKHRYEVQI